MTNHQVVSKDEWLTASRMLLEQEKAQRRRRQDISHLLELRPRRGDGSRSLLLARHGAQGP